MDAGELLWYPCTEPGDARFVVPTVLELPPLQDALGSRQSAR